MDPHTGNSASAAASKKDKKSKKNYDDGDGKKKFVSIHHVSAVWVLGLKRVASYYLHCWSCFLPVLWNYRANVRHLYLQSLSEAVQLASSLLWYPIRLKVRVKVWKHLRK